MSELTQCNFCSLNKYKRLAKKSGMKLTKCPGWNGGIDILIHPKDVIIPNGILDDENPLRKKYLVSWMQEISNYCCC